MTIQKRVNVNQISTFVMLSLGVAVVIGSMFYPSSFLAILGLSIIFWAAILFYIKPVKHVPLVLLNALAETSSSNIERILTEMDLTEKGVYLPPKSLKNIESSLIFIPETIKTPLPTPEETSEKLYSENKKGVFITPPGYSLSRIFEKELRTSFTKTDLAYLQVNLPKLFTEELQIAETAEIRSQGNTITVELTNNIFKDICRETDNQPRSHAQVGCLLSSALACVFAKVSGKPIIIQSEIQTPETKTVTIEYNVKEE